MIVAEKISKFSSPFSNLKFVTFLKKSPDNKLKKIFQFFAVLALTDEPGSLNTIPNLFAFL